MSSDLMAVSIENSEHYRWGDGCDGWHLAKTRGLSVIQEAMPPGRREVPHYHEHAEQFFYVLSGVATIESKGKSCEVHHQQGMYIPAGTEHLVSNCGEQILQFIVVSSPPSHGDRVTLTGSR